MAREAAVAAPEREEEVGEEEDERKEEEKTKRSQHVGVVAIGLLGGDWWDEMRRQRGEQGFDRQHCIQGRSAYQICRPD